METEVRNSEDKIDPEVLELIKARLRTIPKSIRISIGNSEFSKEDILKSIDEQSDIGIEFIEMQMDYLKDLTSGALYGS